MDVPILLVHGSADRRVDVEHAFRMRAMLDANRVPFEWLLIDEMGHSPTAKQASRVLTRVRRFLRAHLAAAP